jgi:hypothetical protein
MGQAWIDPGAEAKYGYVLPFIAVKTAGLVQFDVPERPAIRITRQMSRPLMNVHVST